MCYTRVYRAIYNSGLHTAISVINTLKDVALCDKYLLQKQ